MLIIPKEILERIRALEEHVASIESKISGNLVSRYDVQRLLSELDLLREEQFQLRKLMQAIDENNKVP
jgi:hypothetical protein